MANNSFRIGDVLQKNDSPRTFRTVEGFDGFHVRLRKPNGTPCTETLSDLETDYHLIAHLTGYMPTRTFAQKATGAVLLKGACCYDAKGREIRIGHTVADSFGEIHRIIAIEPIDADHAWLVDEKRNLLIPHLTEQVEE